jgi:hypothetical protein
VDGIERDGEGGGEGFAQGGALVGLAGEITRSGTRLACAVDGDPAVEGPLIARQGDVEDAGADRNEGIVAKARRDEVAEGGFVRTARGIGGAVIEHDLRASVGGQRWGSKREEGRGGYARYEPRRLSVPPLHRARG